MDAMYYVFEPIMIILSHEFEIFGYQISLLSILIFSALASLCGLAISRLFGG